jgi:hypothetical protein
VHEEGAREIDTANFSEFHPAPGFEPPSSIRLVALRTHTCVSAKTNILCHQDIVVDPEGAAFQYQEPYVVRDLLNINTELAKQNWPAVQARPEDRRKREYDGPDPDRYRNFATAPFAVAAPGRGARGASGGPDVPVLAWIRRGESRGEGYNDEAILRRAHRDKDEGLAYQLVQLREFPESADPVFVLDRTSTQPRLLSMSMPPANSSGGFSFRQWLLPMEFHPPGSACPLTKEAERVSLKACAQAEVDPKEVGEKCAAGLDRSWTVRRPVVLNSANAAGGAAYVVFSRVGTRDAGQVKAVTVELKILVWQGAECVLIERGPFDLGAQLAPNIDQNARDKERQLRARAERIKGLRQSPIMVADIDADGEPDFIVPDAEKPTRSVLLRKPST